MMCVMDTFATNMLPTCRGWSLIKFDVAGILSQQAARAPLMHGMFKYNTICMLLFFEVEDVVSSLIVLNLNF